MITKFLIAATLIVPPTTCDGTPDPVACAVGIDWQGSVMRTSMRTRCPGDGSIDGTLVITSRYYGSHPLDTWHVTLPCDQTEQVVAELVEAGPGIDVQAMLTLSDGSACGANW